MTEKGKYLTGLQSKCNKIQNIHFLVKLFHFCFIKKNFLSLNFEKLQKKRGHNTNKPEMAQFGAISKAQK